VQRIVADVPESMGIGEQFIQGDPWRGPHSPGVLDDGLDDDGDLLP
jgi:hypothetical protein